MFVAGMENGKQLDKSAVDENHIEQNSVFTRTINHMHKTFTPLTTMNPDTKEKIANINAITNITNITNLITNKNPDDSKNYKLSTTT